MSYVPARKSRLLVGDFRLSAYATQITVPWTADMLETTTIEDEAKEFIVGKDDSTLSVTGLYDTAEHADVAAWKSADAQPITYGPSGLALGSEVWMANGLLSELGVEAATGGVSGFTFNAQTDGAIDFGVSLHDLEAETADENGATYDGTAGTSNGGVGNLHVTAFSGLTSAVVKVQHSTNDSVWADLIEFDAVSAVGAQREAVTGTVNRYLRYSIDVTGTGSITLQVGFARR